MPRRTSSAARYYATQYGSWWSFARADLRRLLEAGAAGGGVNLDDATWRGRRVGKPSWRQGGTRTLCVLDFDREAFAAALAELDERGSFLSCDRGRVPF